MSVAMMFKLKTKSSTNLFLGFVIMWTTHWTTTTAEETKLTIAIVRDDDTGVKDLEMLISTVIDQVTTSFNTLTISQDSILWNKDNNNKLPETFLKKINEQTEWDLILDLTNDFSKLNEKLLRDLNTPTVSINYNFGKATNQSANDIIMIRPPGDVISDIIRDFLLKLNLDVIAVIYDNTFEIKMKYLALFRNIPTRHMLMHIDSSGSSLASLLKRMKDSEMKTFLVVASEENLQKILKAADVDSMFGREFRWYAISKDVLKSTQMICTKCHILTISPMVTYEEFLHKVPELHIASNFLTDSSFIYDVLILTLTAMAKLKTLPKMPPVPRRAAVLNEMKNLNYTGILGHFIFNDDGNNYEEIRLELIKLSKLDDNIQTSTKIGHWTFGKTNEQLIKDDAALEKILPITVFKVAVFIKPPFVYKSTLANGTATYTGLALDIIESFQKERKHVWDFYEPPTPEKEIRELNDEWSGVIDEVLDKRADIALGPLFITSEREKVVEFTVPYYDLVGMKILMLKPIVATSMFRFLTVMEPDVWYSILAAYIFTSFLLWIIDRYSPFSYQNNKVKFENDSEKREFSLTECFWFCVTSLTPQGGGEAPKNASGRMVAATWWLFSFIVIASYTANLAAFLTVSRLENPINSLDELASQYKIQYAPVNGSAAMQYFERMAFIENQFFEKWKEMTMDDRISDEDRAQFSVWEYPVSDKYTKILQTIKETGMPQTFEEGIERIRNSSGNFAIIADTVDVKYAAMVNCDLMEVGEEFSRRPVGMAVRKGSPLKGQLTNHIIFQQNSRRLESIKDRWWTGNPHKANCKADDSNADGVSLKNIGGIFIIIFIGMGFSWVMLGFEYWWHRDANTVEAIKENTNIQMMSTENAKKWLKKSAAIKRKNHYVFKT